MLIVPRIRPSVRTSYRFAPTLALVQPHRCDDWLSVAGRDKINLIACIVLSWRVRTSLLLVPVDSASRSTELVVRFATTVVALDSVCVACDCEIGICSREEAGMEGLE